MQRAFNSVIITLQLFLVCSAYTNPQLTPPSTQPTALGGINGAKVDVSSTLNPENTDVVRQGESQEARLAQDIQQLQPPEAQEEVKEKINAASTNGKIDAQKAREIIDDAKMEMARERLNAISQSSASGASSGNTPVQSTKGGSSSGAHVSHGGSIGSMPSPSYTEAYLPRSSAIQRDIQKFSDTLSTYNKTASGILSNKSLASIQNSFINFARNTIDMPRGKEKSLTDNFLFQSLNDETKNSLKDSFLGLVKNSASDKAPSADLPYLKDIVTDENFQFTAEKVLGPENLSYLNAATISADLLNVKALTGATYASFLNLTEGNIAGATASINVTEWMQAANFLSSNTFLASIRDAEFATLMRKGFSDLNETYKRLSALKALDLLDLLESPQKVEMKKMVDAGVVGAISALRQAKRLKSRVGWDSGTLSNFNYFQKNINETLNQAAKMNSSEELLALFDKTLSNNSLRAYWRSFDYPGYFKYRRSVASVYFSIKFQGFKEYKITPQTGNDLIYAKVPKEYPKDNAMFFMTAVAMEYTNAQKKRSKSLADQQKADDKKYLVKQLAGDKYYSNLEDEKD